jgi:hypothetical protein
LLEAFRVLEPRWKTSISAMIDRCKDLGLISETHAGRLFNSSSARGWARGEPDDGLMRVRADDSSRSAPRGLQPGVCGAAPVAAGRVLCPIRYLFCGLSDSRISRRTDPVGNAQRPPDSARPDDSLRQPKLHLRTPRSVSAKASA